MNCKGREPPENRLLTVDQLAEILRISPSTIRNRMCQRLFPIRHKKLGRLVRFERTDVEDYLRRLPSSY